MEVDIDTHAAHELAEQIERSERAAQATTAGPSDSPTTPKGKTRQAPVDPKTQIGADELKGLRSEGECGSCGTSVARAESKVSLFSNQPRDEIYRCAHVTCPSCVVSLCAGCFEPSGCELECESDQSNGCASVVHCSKVRAVLAFEALAALDRLYCPQALKRPASASSDAKKPRASATTAKGKAGPTAGIGYGYDDETTGPTRTRGGAISTEQAEAVQIATAVDARRDQLLTLALKILGELMPHPDADDAEVYDFCPEPTLRPLVLLSSMPELLSELMRNDSITNISERSKLYLAMLAFLSDLAASDVMVDLLIERRRVKAFSDGIGELVRGRGDVEWERTSLASTPPAGYSRKRALSGSAEAEVVVAAPLAQHLRKLTRQSKLYATISADKPVPPPAVGTLGAAAAVLQLPPDEEALKEAEEIRDLAERFVADGKRIEEAVLERKSADDLEAAAAEADATTAPVTVGSAYSSLDSRYADACEELAFAMIDLSIRGSSTFTTSLQHAYSAQLLGSLQMATKNATHLNKELATLATSLPPGIFLRVDESRLNALKCLIAGPVDTPYADGLFEFDLMLGYDYPQSSPQCTLRTTAGGRVRFNPNLYANGKTCLSLLGTWPGRPEENWQPWRSTLLQVFMSINSLIMNDMPFYNEPGFGHPHDSPENKAYNKNVALQNVRWAMLDWMTDTHKNGIWAEVIKMHFTTKRAAIKAQIVKWADVDERMRHFEESTCQLCGQPTVPRGTPNGGLDLVAEFDRRCDAFAQWPVTSSSS